MAIRLPHLALLDLDDTIVSHAEDAEPCWEQACRDHAPRLGPPWTVLYDAILASRSWFWSDRDRHRTGRLDMRAARRRIVTSALSDLGVDSPDKVERIVVAYSDLRNRAVHPLPGAIETLHWMRQQGVALALVTNGAGPAQRVKIDRFELGPLFDLIVIEGEFGAGKPDARVFQHALTHLGAAPAETWMIGDHLEWDVAGPQRLGILGIWLDRLGRGLPPDSHIRPDRTIRALSDLLPPGLQFKTAVGANRVGDR